MLFFGASHDIDDAGGAVFVGGYAVDVVLPVAAVDLAAAVIRMVSAFYAVFEFHARW